MPKYAGSMSDFKEVAAAVQNLKSPQSQLNAVARILHIKGYAASQALKPELHETSVDGSKLLVYVWRDTPFGDDVVLATGPSFEAKLALGSDIRTEPGVGFYVQAVLSKSPKVLPSSRGIDLNEKQQTKSAHDREAAKAKAAEDDSKRAHARETEARHKAELEESKRREAEANRKAEEEKRRAAEERTRAAEERTRAEEAKRHAAEREAAAKKVAPKAEVDQGAAMAEAQKMIAALKAMRGGK